MFKKPFNVKNNANVRNSDRRKLLSRLGDDVNDQLPKKAQLAHVRATAATGQPINIYTFDKQPLLFDLGEASSTLFPTVYGCWLLPATFPTLFVHEQVVKFLENGADLMLPGVIRSGKLGSFPDFPRGAAVAVCAYTPQGQVKGPLAVGSALYSSMEMLASGMQGRGLQILHVYRDHLWEMGTREQPPSVAVADLVKEAKIESEEDYPALGSMSVQESKPSSNGAAAGESAPAESATVAEREARTGDEPAGGESAVGGGEEEEEATSTDTQEEMLMRVFIAALRYRLGKATTLPYDVGQFYSKCLLPCVPASRRLDMKKTKYKKFSEFLKEANKQEGGPLVRISQKGKGNDMITEVFWSHPAITHFKPTDERLKDEAVEKKILGPRIAEYFAVTEPVVTLLNSVHRLEKGDLLETPQVRELVTHYVKSQNLNAGKSVRVDGLLAPFVGGGAETVDWNTLIQRIQAKMTKSFVLTMPDGRQRVRKLNIPKIVFKVETRSGNKKVTLINNTAVFEIEPKAFCQRVQHGVATSATIQGEAQQCEGPQIIVQGNQIHFLGQLLMEDYGIDKKYIDGLDLAPKKKK